MPNTYIDELFLAHKELENKISKETNREKSYS